mmetsp:Transcript_17871/g.36721  ORF Transcript_17871/g.36721 Transcript_17871/m.36721 type:complete len:214 (-) Transcript_17871:211-852(-)
MKSGSSPTRSDNSPPASGIESPPVLGWKYPWLTTVSSRAKASDKFLDFLNAPVSARKASPKRGSATPAISASWKRVSDWKSKFSGPTARGGPALMGRRPPTQPPGCRRRLWLASAKALARTATRPIDGLAAKTRPHLLPVAVAVALQPPSEAARHGSKSHTILYSHSETARVTHQSNHPPEPTQASLRPFPSLRLKSPSRFEIHFAKESEVQE